MNTSITCWCGNANLEKFSPDYHFCASCETLVWVGKNSVMDSSTGLQDEDYYNKNYWFEHQTDSLNLPDITSRARTDLTDRCLHWLKHTLRYQLPPAKTLELGSSHGGFVSLLQFTGYESTGLEISKWISDYAQRTFQIPMLTGKIENQPILEGSFDLIILMDVFEHLGDPIQTMTFCTKLLKESGIIIIQTPCLPNELKELALASEDHIFHRMLIPREHIHLFSEKAARNFFNRLGFDHLYFEPAFYSSHDMFFFASRRILQPLPVEKVENFLLGFPNGRIILALLDLSKKLEIAERRINFIEKDRSERGDIIKQLTRQIELIEEDREERLKLINTLSQQIEVIEQDRAARLGVIQHLEALVRELQSEKANSNDNLQSE